jgi:hypothetical protein
LNGIRREEVGGSGIARHISVPVAIDCHVRGLVLAIVAHEEKRGLVAVSRIIWGFRIGRETSENASRIWPLIPNG